MSDNLMQRTIQTEARFLSIAFTSAKKITQFDLSDADFVSPYHQKLFTVISELSEDYDFVHTPMMLEEMAKRQMPVPEHILLKMDELWEIDAHASYYAKKIIEFACDRKIQNLTDELLKSNQIEGDNSEIIAKLAQAKEEKQRRLMKGKTLSTAKDLYDEFTKNLDDIQEGRVEPSLKSGLIELDKIIGGFELGQMDILAGRPAMGKTSFAMRYMEQVFNAGEKVAFVSLELNKSQAFQKMALYLAKVPYSKATTYQGMDNHEWDKLLGSLDKTHTDQILFYSDDPTIEAIEHYIKTVNRDFGVNYFCIDYVQKINSRKSFKMRDEEMRLISQTLSNLSRILNIHILTLAQVNRGVESKNEKKPSMSDLRESGNLEQDAYKIMLIHKEVVRKFGKKEEEKEPITKIIVDKNRNGPKGDAPVAFIGELSRFDNLSFRG